MSGYAEWLEEALKNRKEFEVGDEVYLDDDPTGKYVVIAKGYEPLQSEDYYTLQQGSKVRYAIAVYMTKA